MTPAIWEAYHPGTPMPAPRFPRPTNTLPDFDDGTPGGGTPPGGGDGTPPGTPPIDQMTPAELVQQLFSMNQQGWENLMPSQRDVLLSIARALGVPEADVVAALQHRWIPGINPAAILPAGFALGGVIRAA